MVVGGSGDPTAATWTQLSYTHSPADSQVTTPSGLIDLSAASMDWLRAAGDDASKAYFMHVPAQDQQDDTHFQQRGAVMTKDQGHGKKRQRRRRGKEKRLQRRGSCRAR